MGEYYIFIELNHKNGICYNKRANLKNVKNENIKV